MEKLIYAYLQTTFGWCRILEELKKISTSLRSCGKVVAFILFTTYSSAREINIRVGNFEVDPSFSISQEFNSNFFSEDDSNTEQPDSEETVIYTPGLRIEYPGENLTFELDYKSSIKRNRYFSDEDTEDQSVSFGFGLISPCQRLKLTLFNQFLDTKDPTSIDARSVTNLNRANRVGNKIEAAIDFKVSELFNLVFNVSHGKDKFGKQVFETENTQTVIYNSSLFYRWLPKTSIKTLYELGTIKYPDAPSIINGDSLKQSLRVGLSFDATSKLAGDATIGYTRKKFTQSDFNASNENTLGVGIDLGWDVRERTTLTFGAERTIDDAVSGTASSITRNDIALGITQEILNKLSLNLTTIFRKSDHEKDNTGFKRIDKLYGFSIDLYYNIQEWISMNVSYQHENNLSNSNSSEYRNNEWIFNINALF